MNAVTVRLAHPVGRLTAVTVARPMRRERRMLARLRGSDLDRTMNALAIVTGLSVAELTRLAEPDLERVAEAFASFAPAPGAP